MKRIVSLICAIVMLFGMLNLTVFASDSQNVASNGTENFSSLQAAVDDYTSGIIILHKDVLDITVTKDVYLDLNGHDITGTVNVTGGTLYCLDSQTDDFTVADGNYGKLTGTVVGNVAGAPVESETVRHGYLKVQEADGISFHCVNLEIYAMSLRSSNVGLYYKSNFAGDEEVADQVASFGVALSVQETPNADNMETKCGYSCFEGFKAGQDSNAGTSNGTLLYGIMKETNAALTNTANANMAVKGRAYIKTADGYLFGNVVSRSLKEQVEAVDDNWTTLTANQRAAVSAMYDTYADVMDQWEIPAIKANEPVVDGDADISIPVAIATENGVVADTVTVSKDGVTVTVPAGVVLAEGINRLLLTVTKLENADIGVELEDNQVLIPMDVHVEGISAENTVPLTVQLGKVMPENLNMGNYTLYHVENGVTNEMTLIPADAEFTSHNQYKYTLDGEVILHMASFSVVAGKANTQNAWNGELDYTWYDADAEQLYIRNADQLAAFGAIVGGMDGKTADSFAEQTITLLSDIDLGDKEADNIAEKIFYPIGYYNNTGSYEKKSGKVGPDGTAVSSGYKKFSGTFDGNGNTIKNFYQNTWEMFGDYNDGYSGTPNHSRDGMGLFGNVYGGTVKNLTVENFSSDGEFATTGVIAAYADSGNGKSATFANITIFDCNPRVYNIGNGGIVGCAGWYSRSDETASGKPVIFKNITVDQTNKISALWGSYDVSCGGILGQYYPDSNCGLKFENCHVAAEMDVNNDVCANYQYYWYRYSGMLMGTVRKNTTEGGYTVADITGIEVNDCTYTLGEWSEYWYCELVKNSLASYTHDHQFSRLTKIADISAISDDNGETWLKEGNFVIPTVGNTSAECFHIFKDSEGNLYRHFHDKKDESNPNIYETFDLDGNGQLDDLKEDRQCYFMPFNQVLSGLGYGVKPTYSLASGFEEVENGTTVSREKFAVKADAVVNFVPGQTVTLGELFGQLVEDSELSNPSVIATVSPLTEKDTISAIFSPGNSDWETGTITFGENCDGKAKIVITDYYYCKATVLEITVGKYTGNLQFDDVDDPTLAYCPACDAKVNWIEVNSTNLQAHVDEGRFGTEITVGGHYHYYLSSDITFESEKAFLYSSSSTGKAKDFCLHLNGHNLTSKNSAVATIGIYSSLNILGTGTVSGNNSTTLERTGSTIVVNGNHETYPGTVRLYSGTYNQATGNEQLSTVSTVQFGAEVEIYKDVTINALDGNYSLYVDTAIGGSATAETIAINGGTFNNAVMIRKAGTGANANAEVNISGGTFNQGIEFYKTNMVTATLSGAPKILGAGLQLPADIDVNLGELTDGAQILVDATDVFTVTNAYTEAYKNYFFGADAQYDVCVNKDNQLYLAPYEHTDALEFRPDGTAYCTVCKGAVVWTPVTNETIFDMSAADTKYHYYLVEAITKESGIFMIAPTKGTSSCCLHLNEYSVTTGSGRALMGYPGVLNVLGTGTVTGGSTGDGSAVCIDTGTATGTINLYSGTYTTAKNTSVIATYSNGGRINIYDDVTVNANNDNAITLYQAKKSTAQVEIIGAKINGTLGFAENKDKQYDPVVIITNAYVEEIQMVDFATLTVAGDTKIDKLTVPAGSAITLGELTEGASIKVDADGVFTVENPLASDYLKYFEAFNTGYEITQADNVLSCTPIVAEETTPETSDPTEESAPEPGGTEETTVTTEGE